MDYAISDFQVGDRVEIHPACDRWMMGDKYATITKVGRVKLELEFDRSGRRYSWSPGNIYSRWTTDRDPVAGI